MNGQPLTNTLSILAVALLLLAGCDGGAYLSDTQVKAMGMCIDAGMRPHVIWMTVPDQVRGVTCLPEIKEVEK